MSLPKVTLLGDVGNTYTLAYGSRTYEFEAGKTQKVPVVIALEAKKRVRGDKPLFRVENMPEIVETPKTHKNVSREQTAPAETPRQQSFVV